MSVIQLSPAAKRWQEVVNDPHLSQRLERIETDARGQVIMVPPPDFIHRSQAKQIQAHLDRLLGQARALTEQPIETDTFSSRNAKKRKASARLPFWLFYK